MASSRIYYDLVASLPPLPYFERADRNPINRERLRDRLSMLEDEDAAVVQRTTAFLAWRRQPAARTDAEMAAMYESLISSVNSPMLRDMVDQRMSRRTIVAALRRKRKGLAKPQPGEVWGVGPWVGPLTRNWDDPDFKLAAIFPWIPPARERLDAREELELDRLLFGVEWSWLDNLVFGNEFSFEALLAFLFKWDILDQWLSYEVEAARERFEELVAEVTGEHYKLFD